MNMIRSNSVKEIWETSIENVLMNGSNTEKCLDCNSIGSYFGLKSRFTKELLGTTLMLSNPRNRVLWSGLNLRKINYSYLFANFLFLFSKDKTIDFIEFYNSKGKLFTDDGKTLNAPLGYRILNDFNQIKQIAKLFNRDSATRRAVIQIYDKYDLTKKTRDVPCLNYFQFFIREEKLHMITNMRSQSVFSIMPYDIFLFSLFQEAFACYLGVELGDYIHVSGSFHIYDDEFEKAFQIVNHKDALSFEMHKMREFNPNIVNELFKAERDIRNLIKNGQIDSIDLSKYNLDDYWKHFLAAMYTAYLYPEREVANIESMIKSPKLNPDIFVR
jgi:thymidylate synthase